MLGKNKKFYILNTKIYIIKFLKLIKVCFIAIILNDLYNMCKEDHIINLSYLKSISDGNNSFILELIDMFIEQVPEYQKTLQDLMDKKDWHNLARTAHKAKSAILMVGMDELSSDLKKLEENAKVKKKIDEYQEIITKFVRHSNIAINKLKIIRSEII